MDNKKENTLTAVEQQVANINKEIAEIRSKDAE